MMRKPAYGFGVHHSVAQTLSMFSSHVGSAAVEVGRDLLRQADVELRRPRTRDTTLTLIEAYVAIS